MLSRGIVHADHVLCTAADEKLAVAIWHGAPTELHVLKVRELVAERVRLYQRAVLLIVVAKPVLPDEAARKQMTAVMDDFRDSLLAINVCIEVDGLFGSALRTMGRAIVLASRSRTPAQFSTNVEQAMRQLEASMVGGSAFDGPRMQRMVEGVRAEYTSRRPPAPEAQFTRS